MRKNILTLMLGLSFVLVGAIVTKAEVSNTFTIVAANVVKESAANEQLSFVKGKLAFLNTLCATMDGCDNALHGAEIAYANAVTTCDHYGYESSNCTSSMGVADRAANVAAEQCNVSTNIRKNILVFPEINVSRKREDRSS